MSVSSNSPLPHPQPAYAGTLETAVPVPGNGPTPERPQAEVSPATSATSSSLPVPVRPRLSQLTSPREEPARPSFWRRIKMRKRSPQEAGSGSTEDTAARLLALEQQLVQLDSHLQMQLETLSERLEEVWQSEEQLSLLADIQEKLDRLAQQQSSLSHSLTHLKRSLGWLAILVVATVAGAGFALQWALAL